MGNSRPLQNNAVLSLVYRGPLRCLFRWIVWKLSSVLLGSSFHNEVLYAENHCTLGLCYIIPSVYIVFYYYYSQWMILKAPSNPSSRSRNVSHVVWSYWIPLDLKKRKTTRMRLTGSFFFRVFSWKIDSPESFIVLFLASLIAKL